MSWVFLEIKYRQLAIDKIVWRCKMNKKGGNVVARQLYARIPDLLIVGHPGNVAPVFFTHGVSKNVSSSRRVKREFARI